MSGYQQPQDPSDRNNPAGFPNNSPPPSQPWPNPPGFYQNLYISGSQYANITQGNSFSHGSAQVSGNQASNAGHYYASQSPHGTVFNQPDYQSSTNNANSIPQEYSPIPQGQCVSRGYPTSSTPSTYSDYSTVPSFASEAYDSGTLNSTPQYGIEPVPATYQDLVNRPIVYIDMAPTWESCVATKDSGTKENWISQDIVNRFQLEVKRGTLRQSTTFNGGTLSSFETVKPAWCLQGAQRSYTCEFRVVENPPFDVLFGRHFLEAHPGVLDSNAASRDPVQVLVQTTKESNEQREIEDNRKRKDKDSAALQKDQRKGGSSRSSAGAAGQKHASNSKSSHKKGSKGSR